MKGNAALTFWFKTQFGTEHFPLHTGELSPERITHLLTAEEREKLESEWEQLSTQQEVLRIWQEGKLHHVDASYFDDFIISKAKKLDRGEFMKSARLIGEVIGHLEQYIGDGYVEYRVRHLIINGVFDIEGVPKAMRFYSVKLR
ncbi:DUF3658 domain-containing protein [Radiobacillus sp. PE A8.2]|uniref:DUF3658 domain-containing protein n=1 Tax=Radiobacillus sp. PE A8.2 TaxID=3380349 RepID=UPI00388D2BC8